MSMFNFSLWNYFSEPVHTKKGNMWDIYNKKSNKKYMMLKQCMTKQKQVYDREAGMWD